jgi:hypothetical protein
MKYILLIIYSIILPIFSVKQITPKLCMNCKYFIQNNNFGIFSKCSFFPNKQNEIIFLVNGIDKEEYSYCYTARKSVDMCGKEGKMYKKKYIRKCLKK